MLTLTIKKIIQLDHKINLRKSTRLSKTETLSYPSLDSKTKRLMALSIALTHGCRGCIIFQTEQALEASATVDEVLEACSVSIAVGGTMTGGETSRVIQLLREIGKIE